MDYKELIATKIANSTQMEIDKIKSYIEIPPNKEMGDYSFPCFRLAKEMKKAPPIIAEELKKSISLDKFVERIEVIGGYVNFFMNKEEFIRETLQEIITKKNDYGKNQMGNGKTIVIDYSAPNIAKPFHIGHLRSTVIGGALYKIYHYLGYKVIGINHIGDWGMGVSKSIAGYEMWKEEYDFTDNAIGSLLKYMLGLIKRKKKILC